MTDRYEEHLRLLDAAVSARDPIEGARVLQAMSKLGVRPSTDEQVRRLLEACARLLHPTWE